MSGIDPKTIQNCEVLMMGSNKNCAQMMKIRTCLAHLQSGSEWESLFKTIGGWVWHIHGFHSLWNWIDCCHFFIFFCEYTIQFHLLSWYHIWKICLDNSNHYRHTILDIGHFFPTCFTGSRTPRQGTIPDLAICSWLPWKGILLVDDSCGIIVCYNYPLVI